MTKASAPHGYLRPGPRAARLCASSLRASLRTLPRLALLLAPLLAGAVSLAPGSAAAQELPLVSRQLRFHEAPATRPAEPPARASTRIEVITRSIPRVPLPPGARIRPALVDPASGRYREPEGERGIVLPEAPAQQPESAMPRLVVGQTYIPPWFDEVRNVRGGRGPDAPVPRAGQVGPEDLRISPPRTPERTPESALPEAAPRAPLQRSGAPAPQASATPQATSSTPQAAPAPNGGPPRSAASAGGAAPASPVPLVSRKLNFRY